MLYFSPRWRRSSAFPRYLPESKQEGFSGYLWPQLLDVFPGQVVVERSSMNAWDDAGFRAAIEATGKKNILLTGLWTEVCVAWPCIEMMAAGYTIYVVEDCCGATSVLAHDAALSRMVQAGAIRLTTIAAVLEWQRDWARKEHYGSLMDIIKEHGGAYGAGVEYAYTMVHKAPQSAHKSPRRRLEALICVSSSTPPISTESRRAHSPCHHATRPARIRRSNSSVPSATFSGRRLAKVRRGCTWFRLCRAPVLASTASCAASPVRKNGWRSTSRQPSERGRIRCAR
jgi:nicotinamidase-related amidase